MISRNKNDYNHYYQQLQSNSLFVFLCILTVTFINLDDFTLCINHPVLFLCLFFEFLLHVLFLDNATSRVSLTKKYLRWCLLNLLFSPSLSQSKVLLLAVVHHKGRCHMVIIVYIFNVFFRIKNLYTDINIYVYIFWCVLKLVIDAFRNIFTGILRRMQNASEISYSTRFFS